ncbi:unnamed protein product [Aureobasidium pullulans]|nr:unnamed protein product [Aureobasidium pullulans]
MGYKSGRLFEVPIGTNGKVVVTRLAERVYMLMWNSAPDNRLTTYPHGVVITTSGISKFYSNGLDLEHANANPNFTKDSLFALWKKLLTYPMPTIALINGHGFAGALMTAMMHDYRIMNPHRGYICLNEEPEVKEKVRKQDEELKRKAEQRVKDWETAKAKL